MTQLLAAAEGGHEFQVLGVPLSELIMGSIAFLIVFGVLGKVLLPKINQILEEREEAIEGGLKRADEALAEAAQMRDDYKEQIAKAREEASAIRNQAQAEKAAIIEEARAAAQEEAAKVTANAQAQIEAEKSKAVSELHKSVGTMATTLAGRIVGESLSDDAKASAVVDRFIDELEQSDTKVGSE